MLTVGKDSYLNNQAALPLQSARNTNLPGDRQGFFGSPGVSQQEASIYAQKNPEKPKKN